MLKLLLRNFIVLYLSAFVTASFANEQNLGHLKYNQKKSVSFNEKRFLSNLKFDCQTKGYQRSNSELTPNDVLATYPKELAFLYLKKNIKKFCYYSFSMLIKYLYQDFRNQTEDLIVDVVNKCLLSVKTYQFCPEFQKTATLFDLTILLGNYCSNKTLKTFKKVNCQYKKIAERECSLYTDLNKSSEACPYHFTNKREVQDLHKSYFGKHCRRLKWRNPKCMAN